MLLSSKIANQESHAQAFVQMFEDAPRGSRLLFQHALCPLTQPQPPISVLEKLLRRAREISGVTDSDGSVGTEEKGRDIAEILHVWSEQNGLTPESRFEQVVTTRRNEAAAHKDDVCQLEDPRQLADRVEQQNLRRFKLRCELRVSGFERGAAHEAQS